MREKRENMLLGNIVFYDMIYLYLKMMLSNHDVLSLKLFSELYSTKSYYVRIMC